MNDYVTVCGVPGSPYTRKMLAVLRYRRIPYRMIISGSPESAAMPAPKVPIVPVLMFPGEKGVRVDSTPLIIALDEAWPGRKIAPADPATAFLDALIEDFGDEWLTKAMFHYRWAYRADIEQAAAILPRWAGTMLPEPELRESGRSFADRQVNRLWVVGSNETTRAIIEASYARTLNILDRCLTGRRFLLGDRPCAGDFAIYGQLTQLALFDPTPMALAMRDAPRVVAWTQLVDDLSGLEVEAASLETPENLADPVRELLGEIGRVYAPFMLANARAIESGAEQVTCEIDSAPWVQKPFPYQAKCLAVLRQRYATLAERDRARVDRVLDGTGSEALFA